MITIRRRGFLKIIFFLCTGVLLYSVILTDNYKNYFRSLCASKGSKIYFKEEKAASLLKLAKHIVRAHRYSRSGKTIYELNEAFKIVQEFLYDSIGERLNATLDLLRTDLTSSSPSSIKQQAEGSEPEICPEIYPGMMQGYPYYFTGYKTDNVNCTGQPLGSILTVLVNAVHDVKLHDLPSILAPLQQYYPNVTVLTAHSTSDVLPANLMKFKNFFPVSFGAGKTAGNVWNSLAQRARTKYVFISRQVIQFDNHTRFERLLRFLSHGVAEAVGTSHRYLDGRWFRGCHVTALRNYTLKFVDGYDLSYNSCIYCDYLTGPFAMKRQTFLNYLETYLNQDTVFVDLFLKLSQQLKTVFACPDVMMIVQNKELQQVKKNDWLHFIRKWKLNRIVFSDKRDLMFTCAESKMICPSTGGLIMPLCCIKELTDMIKFTYEILTAHNIDLELDAGTNIGAAKLYSVTPYERDADLNFDVRGHKIFADLHAEFHKRGYTIEEDKTDYAKCAGDMSKVNCGYFGVRDANWRIDMWGVNYFSSDEAARLGLSNKTVVSFDGIWIKTAYSPAENARNKYHDDMYQHIEYWKTLGFKHSWVQPKTGQWLPCPNRGFHGCLDMYLPVGNIQFQDVWV